MKNFIYYLFFFSLFTQAQVNLEWSNYPGGVSVAVNQLHDVYSANWEYNPGGDITLTKRNASGIVLWSATYDNVDNTRHEVATWIETDSQNNCLVAGTIRSGFSNPVNAASLLMKYNPQGDLLWRVVFEDSFEGSYTRKVLIDTSDNIYVLGLGMGQNGLVTRVKKFNSDGEPVWTYYDVNGVGAPINFKFTPDNALVVSGRSITGIINGYLKISTDGNLLWNKVGISSPTIGDVAGDSVGNSYIINGENAVSNAGSILEKLDENGVTTWSETNTMAGGRVEVGSDNNPIISGFPNSGTGGAAFMKYNADGAVLWQNLNADGPEILLLHGQLKLDAANNAYLSAGNLFNMAVCKINADGTNGWVGLVSGSSSASSFVIDTDNSIYVVGGTTAKLGQSPLGITTTDVAPFAIFPNPFFAEFTIISKNEEGEKKVLMYDVTGKLIYENKFTGLNANINLNDISNGIYFLTITDRFGKIHRHKLIKK